MSRPALDLKNKLRWQRKAGFICFGRPKLKSPQEVGAEHFMEAVVLNAGRVRTHAHDVRGNCSLRPDRVMLRELPLLLQPHIAPLPPAKRTLTLCA